MSKAARVREANAEKNRLKREREEFEAKKRKVRKITAIITVSLILVLVLLTFIGTMVYNARMNSGEYLRSEIAASSRNIDVNGAMMNYYFNDVYNTFVDYYGSYVSYYGLDTTQSTKGQEFSDGESWFAYFMSGAESNVSGILALNEAAAANGVSLSEDETEAVRIRADHTDEALYGRGVNSDDIYNSKLLEALAYKYQFMKQDEFAPSVSEINTRYNENPAKYQSVDFLAYDFSWSDGTLTQEEAEAAANELADAKGVDEFKAALGELILAESPELTEDELAEKIEQYLLADSVYSEGNELSEWAFGGAEVGDTIIITDDNYSRYIVYLLISEPTRDESATANVRHILFSDSVWGSEEEALVQAKKVLAEFQSGDMSEESFATLALAYSEDEGSYYHGGLYDNIVEGQMITEFNDWCFDPSRKPGDVEIITTTFGYHIMYYSGEGLPVWQASVSDDIVSERFEEYGNEIAEEYTVLFDDRVLNMIPG